MTLGEYPFGLKHKGYNNVINGTDHPYGFGGEEETNELGMNVVAYQWRDYDPAIGRFNKIDRFAEKYVPISPYAFTANNPVFFREIKGDSINLAHLREHDIEAYNKLKSDLEHITGLSLIVDADGNVDYVRAKKGSKKAKLGDNKGSKTARRKLMKAIRNKNMVTVKDHSGSKNRVPDESPNTILYDNEEIETIMNGAKGGLNPNTYGYGLTFMHELGHTKVGGRNTDFRGGDIMNGYLEGGPNVKPINKMRRELGSDYGYRATYHWLGPVNIDGVAHSIMPFSSTAKKSAENKEVPSTMYIMLTTAQTGASQN